MHPLVYIINQSYILKFLKLRTFRSKLIVEYFKIIFYRILKWYHLKNIPLGMYRSVENTVQRPIEHSVGMLPLTMRNIYINWLERMHSYGMQIIISCIFLPSVAILTDCINQKPALWSIVKFFIKYVYSLMIIII